MILSISIIIVIIWSDNVSTCDNERSKMIIKETKENQQENQSSRKKMWQTREIKKKKCEKLKKKTMKII